MNKTEMIKKNLEALIEEVEHIRQTGTNFTVVKDLEVLSTKVLRHTNLCLKLLNESEG
ncbi:hypothetical protein [Acinetobacter baumannii]|uniref:hypothetical protein n=2 Tax=Acinetobacter TaxID=469 RepID=UPI00129303A9|nr:hypothetical protein [Acinetobacter baumannii]